MLADLQEILLNPPRFLRRHPDYAKAREVIVRANMETASEPYYSEPGSLAQSALEAIRASLRIEAHTERPTATLSADIFPGRRLLNSERPRKAVSLTASRAAITAGEAACIRLTNVRHSRICEK